jgi:hypothetical protein
MSDVSDIILFYFLPCLRCGTDIDQPETGRPRKYCGDTCRQAGYRLHRKLGIHWFMQQPWYQPWIAEQTAKRERRQTVESERERKQAGERAERERAAAERQAMLDAMTPDERQAHEAAEAEASRRRADDFELLMVQLKLSRIAEQHEEVLRRTGHQVRLTGGDLDDEPLTKSELMDKMGI